MSEHCCTDHPLVSVGTGLLVENPASNCEALLSGTYPGIPVDKNGDVQLYNGSDLSPIILSELRVKNYGEWDTLVIKEADGTITSLAAPDDGNDYAVHAKNGLFFFGDPLGGGGPAGIDTQLQLNNSGAFGGANLFQRDWTNSYGVPSTIINIVEPGRQQGLKLWFNSDTIPDPTSGEYLEIDYLGNAADLTGATGLKTARLRLWANGSTLSGKDPEDRSILQIDGQYGGLQFVGPESNAANSSSHPPQVTLIETFSKFEGLAETRPIGVFKSSIFEGIGIHGSGQRLLLGLASAINLNGINYGRDTFYMNSGGVRTAWQSDASSTPSKDAGCYATWFFEFVDSGSGDPGYTGIRFKVWEDSSVLSYYGPGGVMDIDHEKYIIDSWVEGPRPGNFFSEQRRFAITSFGALKMREHDESGVVEPAIGQIWVKDDAPNTLWFTDDSGSDFLIGGTGTVTLPIDLTSEVTGDLPFANLEPATGAGILLGRGDSGGGDFEELTLGTGLSITGTVLSASGGGGGAFTTTDSKISPAATVTLNDSSGDEIAYNLPYTVNKAAGGAIGLDIGMVDTSSPGTDYLIRARAGVSGTSDRFRVAANGSIWTDAGEIDGNGTFKINFSGTSWSLTQAGASQVHYLVSSGVGEFKLRSTGAFCFTNNAASATTIVDVRLSRGGNGILRQLNGTTGQAYHLYNTTNSDGSPTVWERLNIEWSGNVATIKTSHNGATLRGLKIGGAATDLVGFYDATSIVQPSGTGETTGFTAGAGTGVNDDSTFTGSVGATAYRINDIVKALKNLGLIAS